jgi:hypothetical protein
MRTRAPDVPDLRPHLARTLATLTVPQGYTLSIAGTFAIASHRYGSPFLAEAWGFVAGAVLAFVALAAFSGRHLERPAALPSATRATFNVVPVASVLLGAAAAYAVPWPLVGFPAAGAVAVSGYVTLVSVFFFLVGR